MIHRLLSRSTKDKRLNVEHEQLVSLINSMADGVLAVDSSMKVAISNGAALNLLDINNTLIGRQLGEVLRPINKDNQPVDIEKMVSQSKVPSTTRELLLSYSDGSKSNLYLSIAPVHLGYGKKGRMGYVLLMRDITHEKSLEEERDEFISVISHEIRTPIAITEGNVSNAQFIVDKSGDREQVKAALQQAHDQIMLLSDMVNDLSTLSRAERNKLTVEITPIDPAQLVNSLVATYSKDANAKGLVIQADVSGKPATIHSSDLYVREILQNFVTNAIKYTEKGTVTIGATSKGAGVVFTIKDSGIGISKSDQDKIFDKFFRSEDYRTRKTSGTGLGLYVAMKLARLLHAEIDVESELNHGSTFSVFVPNLQ